MKQFKNTSKGLSEAKGSFNGSEEATDFMYELESDISDKRLMDWAKITDSNMGYKTVPLLKKAIQAYEKFITEMERMD